MATINNFEDLRVWQKARLLCSEVFELIGKEMFCKDYKLKDQINGSSGSIMDNIAEGFGRQGNNEFTNFLNDCQRFGTRNKISTIQGIRQKIYSSG